MVRALQGVIRDRLGQDAPLTGASFGSDMGLLVREGRTPTVLFGPGDIRRAHVPDEAVSVKALTQTAEVLALTILRFCGHEDDNFS